MVKEFNSTLWTVKKIFFYHIKIKLKNMDNWLAKTTQDVVFSGLNWAKNSCLIWRVLRMCWDIAEMTIKCFFVSFSCSVSHENETGTKRRFQRSSLLVFPCYLWVCTELLIELQYTKMTQKTFYCHFCNVSKHSEHAPCEATVSKNLIHPTG